MAASDGTADPLIIVISGPGGVGKGTIVNALVERDPNLWLSRSWTTRATAPRRSRHGAYVFTDRADFEERIDARRVPRVDEVPRQLLRHADAGRSSTGATWCSRSRSTAPARSRRCTREAVLIFVLPPSRDEQQRRLRGRGDPEDKVDQRLRKALDEEPVGLAIADHVVVNDDLERTVDEMLTIIAPAIASVDASRSRRYTAPPLSGG